MSEFQFNFFPEYDGEMWKQLRKVDWGELRSGNPKITVDVHTSNVVGLYRRGLPEWQGGQTIGYVALCLACQFYTANYDTVPFEEVRKHDPEVFKNTAIWPDARSKVLKDLKAECEKRGCPHFNEFLLEGETL